MLNALRLLLPALIPSWRFFDVIAPSPRIEYALTASAGAEPTAWRAFRPLPAHLPIPVLFRRLVWNPRWNETLFMVSCAERLVDQPTAHSEDQIFACLAADIGRSPDAEPDLGAWLTFRLVFLAREGEAIVGEELYRALPRRRADIVPA